MRQWWKVICDRKSTTEQKNRVKSDVVLSCTLRFIAALQIKMCTQFPNITAQHTFDSNHNFYHVAKLLKFYWIKSETLSRDTCNWCENTIWLPGIWQKLEGLMRPATCMCHWMNIVKRSNEVTFLEVRVQSAALAYAHGCLGKIQQYINVKVTSLF